MQYKSMAEMQQIQPMVKALQAKLKSDPQKMNQEVMALYKEHNVNPFASCLPLLVQLPILFSLYWAIIAEKPVFGTCAGAILLAREVRNPAQRCLGILDAAVERNAYGRQIDSAILTAETALEGGPLEMVFIRAPRIVETGSAVEVLAQREAERPCLHGERELLRDRLRIEDRDAEVTVGDAREVGAELNVPRLVESERRAQR